MWAEGAYQSKASREKLAEMEIRNHVHERAYRNRLLTAEQKAANTRRSRVRARVEHPFAFVKMIGGDWLRTIGIERATRGTGMTNLVYNLCRFVQLGATMKAA